MNAEEWAQLTTIVSQAENLAPESREQFIESSLGNRPALVRLAKKMLQALAIDRTRMAARVGRAMEHFAADRPLQSGDDVAGYTVRRLIGRGGMGAVYLATRRTEEYSMDVALKIVADRPDGTMAGPADVSELRFLAGLSHPNIARLIDGGRDPVHDLYLVTEYVDGRGLKEFVAEEAPATAERLQLFLTLCDAVQHAHNRLVIHCDIKPSNVLVDREGVAKLLDFGIASALDDREAGDGWQRRQAFTPQYASPEQLLGGELSTASDVYSLGVLLFELLTDQSPFAVVDGDSDEATHEQRLATRMRFDPTAQPGLALDLALIIARATATDEASRYASAHDMSQDIVRYLRRQPVSVRADNRVYRFRRFIQRNHLPAFLATSLFVALGAFLATSLMQSARLRVERDRLAVERTAKAASTDFLAGTLQQLDAITPSDSVLPATREFLFSLAERADREIAEVPAAHAEILRVVGDALHTLGDYGKASELLQRSLAVSYSQSDPDQLDLALTHAKLAIVISAAGDYEEALPHLEQAGQLLDAATDGETVHHARLALTWGARERILGDFEASERHLLRAVEIFRRTAGDNPAELAEAIDSLGYHNLFVGRPAEAAGHFREARAITADVLGKEHVNFGRQTSHLATALRELNRLEEAAPMYRDAIAILGSTLGPDHGYVINTRTEYGRVLQLMQQFDDAREQYRRALASSEKTFGARHYQSGIQHLNFGNLDYQVGALEESRSAYAQAYDIISATLPANNVFRGAAILGLAMVDLDEGYLVEANEHAQAASRIFADGVGNSHWYYDLAQCIVALIEARNGHAERAETTLQTHLPRLREKRHEADFRLRRIERELPLT